MPVKPENKIIDVNSINKIIVILSDDNLLTPIFYESFVKEIENYPNIPKIDFIYSLTDINSKIELSPGIKNQDMIKILGDLIEK